MSRFCITGAAGFVGAEVCRQALARGHSIIGLDQRPVSSDMNYAFHVADVTDRESMARIVRECDGIIHCAAVVGPAPASADPVMATQVNVLGTLSVLEAARGANLRVVNLSTATLYGRIEKAGPLDESDPVNPVGIYDATKMMSETLCDAYRKSFSVSVASFRTGFVYGPRHSTGDYFVGRLMQGETVIQDAGRDHPCDFTYVKDLALGLVQSAECGNLPESIYNLSGGVLRTRGELAAIVMKHFPHAQIALSPGVDPARHLRGANVIARARRDFGYAPQYDLEAGIADWIAEARGAGAA